MYDHWCAKIMKRKRGIDSAEDDVQIRREGMPGVFYKRLHNHTLVLCILTSRTCLVNLSVS